MNSGMNMGRGLSRCALSAVALLLAGAAAAKERVDPQVRQVDAITARNDALRDMMADSGTTSEKIVDFKLRTPGSVAQYHAGSGKEPSNAGLHASALKSKEAIERAAATIAKAEPGAKDDAQKFVVETGKKVVDVLATTYNEAFAAAHKKLSGIRAKVDDIAATALVIASKNGCGSGQTKPAQRAQQAVQARSTYRDPGEDSLGAQIEATTAPEIPLAENAKEELRRAQEEIKEVRALLAVVPKGLDEAEKLTASLTEQDGVYRGAMKGASAMAESTRRALQGPIADVGRHWERADARIKELDGFLNGPLGETINRILDCSRATNKMGKDLQRDLTEAEKLASADEALAKNREAVGAVQKMAPIYMQLAMADWELSDGRARVSGYSERNAPKAGTMDAPDAGKANKVINQSLQ